jgi:hypothetical protein
MAQLSVLKLTLSGIIGAIIAIVIMALINLFSPLKDTLIPTSIAVCASSVLSGIVGNLLGPGKLKNKKKKEEEEESEE